VTGLLTGDEDSLPVGDDDCKSLPMSGAAASEELTAPFDSISARGASKTSASTSVPDGVHMMVIRLASQNSWRNVHPFIFIVYG